MHFAVHRLALLNHIILITCLAFVIFCRLQILLKKLWYHPHRDWTVQRGRENVRVAPCMLHHTITQCTWEFVLVLARITFRRVLLAELGVWVAKFHHRSRWHRQCMYGAIGFVSIYAIATGFDHEGLRYCWLGNYASVFHLLPVSYDSLAKQVMKALKNIALPRI